MRNAALAISLALLTGCKTEGDIRRLVGNTDPIRPTIEYDALPKHYVPSNQAIGDEGDVANHRASGLGFVEVPTLSKYLNDILIRIKRESNLENAPGRIYITASGDPDAQASADGNIYVSIGMLKNIDTEDEVVALLAHEFAHVAFGHHDSDTWGNYQKQIQTVYEMAAHLHSKVKGGDASAAPSGRHTLNIQNLDLMVEITDKLLHPAWKRHQEEQADRFAIDITTRLGYSFGRGKKSILEKIATLDETVQKEKDTAFQAQLKEEALGGKFDLETVAQLTGAHILSYLSRDHDDSSKRITSAIAYHESLYDDHPRPEPNQAAWRKVIQTPGVKAVLDNYRLADDAALALLRKDAPRALTLAKQAAKRPTDDHPYTLIMLAKAQSAAGERKGYEQTTVRITNLKEPVWPLYEMQAELEFQHGRRDRAQQIMETGYERFGGAPSLRPRMIGFYTKIGHKDKANSMTLDCSFQTPGQREACLKAGGSAGTHRRSKG